MTPFNHNALYAAFQTVVAEASGLPGTRVIWGSTSGDRPPDQNYITLKVLMVEPLHQLTEDFIGDNPTPTAGNEVVVSTEEHFEMIIEVQAFAVTRAGEYPAAPHMLEVVRNYLGRTATLDDLRAVSATIVNRGTVRHLPTVLNTMFESRAVLEVRLRGRSGHSETTTYIETVDYSVNITS